MIPKRLFFIWIGKDIPQYVNFCINAFRKTNPDFEIEFVHENSINNDNLDFKEVSDILKDKESIYYKIWSSPFKKRNLNHSTISRNIWFSDILRIYLVNKYGGIYLDCDTYPIKPFDNKLLSLKCFNIMTKNRKNEGYTDCFFIGSQIGEYFKNKRTHILTNVFSNYEIKTDKVNSVFYKNRNNFFNCIEDFDLDYCMKNKYIIHFKALEWMK